MEASGKAFRDSNGSAGLPEVVEYLKNTLSGIIEKWNIEWLKWDPSGSSPFDQVCARTDHGHQEGNGTFAALRGEQEIRQFLVQKFPHLVIEQLRPRAQRHDALLAQLPHQLRGVSAQ